MYLVRNNYLSSTRARLIKRTRIIKTTKEIFVVIIKENKVEAKTPLQQVSTLLSKKKKIRKTCLRSSAIVVIKRIIMQQSVLSQKKTKISQKISDSLDNLCIDGLI